VIDGHDLTRLEESIACLHGTYHQTSAWKKPLLILITKWDLISSTQTKDQILEKLKLSELKSHAQAANPKVYFINAQATKKSEIIPGMFMNP
jgi:predicted GTPase